jgi:homoserine kinase type II
LRVTKDDLQRVLAHYDLGELGNARRIERGFVNENWALETSRGRYFLKRRHPDLRNPGVIGAQHALIEHLRRAGFPAPTILLTTGGATFLVLGEELYEIQGYIEGMPYDHTDSAHFQEAASTLALYHILVRDLSPPALLCYRGELYSPTILSTNLANLTKAWQLDQDPELSPLLRQLATHAADLGTRYAGQGVLPQLVIHGDYYAGNLLFEDDHVVGVVDYDKACWQPRVAELAEALIYFASPRPGHLRHLVYPGFLDWEPFTRFLRHYARANPPDESEVHALPDYVRCIWLSVSLQRLLEKGPRPANPAEALHEVLALGNWAADHAHRMVEIGHAATGTHRSSAVS